MVKYVPDRGDIVWSEFISKKEEKFKRKELLWLSHLNNTTVKLT